MGYIARLLGIGGLLTLLSGCYNAITGRAPAPAQSFYDFNRYAIVTVPAAPSGHSRGADNFPGSTDPSSDAHELEGRIGLYARAIASTEGDLGLSEGARYRFRPRQKGSVTWEADLRAENTNGTNADDDGPDDRFDSQTARAAALLRWKAGSRKCSAALGIEGYGRDSHDGQGPDIRSSGPYAAFRFEDPDLRFGAMVSRRGLAGRWDYSGASGEPYDQERWFLLAKKWFENGAYAGLEFEAKDTDYGASGPMDKKREAGVVVGKKYAGGKGEGDVHLTLSNESWEHTYADDESHLELTVEGTVPLVDRDDQRADFMWGVELSEEGIKAMVGVKTDL